MKRAALMTLLALSGCVSGALEPPLRPETLDLAGQPQDASQGCCHPIDFNISPAWSCHSVECPELDGGVTCGGLVQVGHSVAVCHVPGSSSCVFVVMPGPEYDVYCF